MMVQFAVFSCPSTDGWVRYVHGTTKRIHPLVPTRHPFNWKDTMFDSLKVTVVQIPICHSSASNSLGEKDYSRLA